MRRAWIMGAGLIGLAVGGPSLAGMASAAAAKGKPVQRPFNEVMVGARISAASGSRFENVDRIKRSPDGGGAAIQDGQMAGGTFPVSGQDGTISFFRNGARTARETFTLGVPNTRGVGTITGKGTCTGGTGFHKVETCTYTFAGTYDLTTSVTRVTIHGTDTRPSTAPFH